MRLRSRAVARPDLEKPLVELHLAYGRNPDSFAIDADEAREFVAVLRAAFGELGERLVSIEPVHELRKEPKRDLVSWDKATEDAQRAYLVDLVEVCHHNVSATAKVAGVDRVHMHRLLNKHGLQR